MTEFEVKSRERIYHTLLLTHIQTQFFISDASLAEVEKLARDDVDSFFDIYESMEKKEVKNNVSTIKRN